MTITQYYDHEIMVPIKVEEMNGIFEDCVSMDIIIDVLEEYPSIPKSFTKILKNVRKNYELIGKRAYNIADADEEMEES